MLTNMNYIYKTFHFFKHLFEDKGHWRGPGMYLFGGCKCGRSMVFIRFEPMKKKIPSFSVGSRWKIINPEFIDHISREIGDDKA